MQLFALVFGGLGLLTRKQILIGGTDGSAVS